MPASTSSPQPPHGTRSRPRERGSRERAGAPTDWRELLVAPDPMSVLERLAAKGDPLQLEAVVARRLARRALLLDVEQVRVRALVRCAWLAAEYRGGEALGGWVRARVDEASDELLSLGGAAGSEELGHRMGVEPEAARRGAARFNRCRSEEREVLLELLAGTRPVDHLARSRGLSLSQVAHLGRRALIALLDEEAA